MQPQHFEKSSLCVRSKVNHGAEVLVRNGEFLNGGKGVYGNLSSWWHAWIWWTLPDSGWLLQKNDSNAFSTMHTHNKKKVWRRQWLPTNQQQSHKIPTLLWPHFRWFGWWHIIYHFFAWFSGKNGWWFLSLRNHRAYCVALETLLFTIKKRSSYFLLSKRYLQKRYSFGCFYPLLKPYLFSWKKHCIVASVLQPIFFYHLI